jgi:ubiquinone/menaquinone biosynthesis C-methylase UbiE
MSEHKHGHSHGHEHHHHHHDEDKKFKDVGRLRTPERLAHFDMAVVVEAALDGLENPQSLLDVGVGTGVFAEAFAGRGLRVAGVDVNFDMLAEARKFLPDAELKEGSAENLPFGDKSFDIVFMGLMLHEVDDPLRTLQEARRVATQRVAALEFQYREEDFGPPLRHRFEPEKVKLLALESGFSRLTMREAGQEVLYIFEP